MAVLAKRSYLSDGVWHDIAHKPYKDQTRAADPEYRKMVDDLIRDRVEGGESAPATHEGRDDEIIVTHRPQG